MLPCEAPRWLVVQLLAGSTAYNTVFGCHFFSHALVRRNLHPHLHVRIFAWIMLSSWNAKWLCAPDYPAQLTRVPLANTVLILTDFLNPGSVKRGFSRNQLTDMRRA